MVSDTLEQGDDGRSEKKKTYVIHFVPQLTVQSSKPLHSFLKTVSSANSITGN